LKQYFVILVPLRGEEPFVIVLPSVLEKLLRDLRALRGEETFVIIVPLVVEELLRGLRALRC
jgi:hypothetical protein